MTEEIDTNAAANNEVDANVAVSERVEGDNATVEQQQQPQSPGFFAVMKGFIIRALIIYFITSFFRRPSQPSTGTSNTSIQNPGGARFAAVNMFSEGTMMDMYAYVNEFETFNFKDPSHFVWQKNDILYGDWTSGPNSDGIFSHSLTIDTTHSVRNNGSIYLHVFVVKGGFSPDPASGEGRYNKGSTIHVSHRLNKFKKLQYRQTSNLITGQTKRSEEEIKKAEKMKEEILSHWHPNITINMVYDYTNWMQGSVPAPLDEYITFSPIGDTYKPILFVNTYWNLYRDYIPINETSNALNLTVNYQPLSLFKWQMYAAQAMKHKWGGAALLQGLSGGEEEDEDQDALKEAFLETSPYLLGLTILVSILHSVFEMLAFKNDVQFWNNRKSLEGLSVRSVFFNVFQSLIVLLYVFDNETNFVIKVSCFIGLGIELWKITKVMDVSLNRERRILGCPTLSFKDKGTYVESSTKKFDEMAFRYLGIALFPLLGGYCAYSLIYHEHKGWYSFVLSMLYGFLLTFGFIMMTPQLFINYKLKSVAHLPWRMLTYKALNTFIDDIFAFVIKMPTMYRLGCLRDDVIFFIFLYQRHIYQIDPSRVNEFGFSQEMEEEAKKDKNMETTNNAVQNAVISGQKSLQNKKND